MAAWLAVAVAVAVSSSPVPAADGPAVVVEEVERRSFAITIEAVGNARAAESIDVRPKISETVEVIHFTEGATVDEGDVLVELDAGTARAAVRQAEASLAESESQFERAQDLYRDRLISDSEFVTRRAARDRDAAALSSAKSRLADTVVRAPFAGRLGLRRVSVGSLVSPETVLTTLDDTDPIKIDFHIPETLVSYLEPGRAVHARTAAYADTVFVGTVETIDTRVDTVSRTVVVRARVDNPDGRLLPGMFLTVELSEGERDALVVPEQAIVPEQSRQFVFVVADGDAIERRAVEVGRRHDGMVEVVDGVAEGERVVVEGTQKVRPGTVVRVVAATEAGS